MVYAQPDAIKLEGEGDAGAWDFEADVRQTLILTVRGYFMNNLVQRGIGESQWSPGITGDLPELFSALQEILKIMTNTRFFFSRSQKGNPRVCLPFIFSAAAKPFAMYYTIRGLPLHHCNISVIF
jgi:hypothetical protein